MQRSPFNIFIEPMLKLINRKIEMVKVLNIMNRMYWNKCNKQRITISHLENSHNEVLPKFNMEHDIKSIMRLNKNQYRKENFCYYTCI